MKVRNTHERLLDASVQELGRFIDGLAGGDDRLWPHDRWPPMRFDRPLGVGAEGGHGPVRYRVVEYVPGSRIAFGFDPEKGLTRGFQGEHYFELEERVGQTLMRHVIRADCSPTAWLRWLLVVRPLHDALLEDALDQVAEAVGSPVDKPAKWSPWVRLLRSAVRART
jgi:hypothetical protein